MRAASFAGLGLLCIGIVACGIDQAPDGARRTPEGDGPLVVFDITRRPLPEIPQPNDVATFADPTSRTGRRINVSLVSPTRLETNARADFTTLEGWGTFAPFTVAFERDPRTPTTDPAIDLNDVYQRTRGSCFGREVKRRIILGTYALSSGYYDAYYLKAKKVRTLIKRDFDQVFEHFDAVVTPTSPNVAFELGAKTQDPLAMYLNDLFTIPTSLAGLPGISVPAGFANGLPVGLQVIGKALDEGTVLHVAHAYEQATDWHNQRSPVAMREPS